MAAPTPLISAPVLSQKQRRAALRKERRKRKRQALAQARGTGLKNGASYAPDDEEDEEINNEDDEDNDIAEEERLRQHEEWLEKERLAQEEFRLRFEREEATRKRKEEEERMIKEEWEAQQRKEQEEKEQKQQEKRGREEAVQKMLDEAENQLDNGGPWMNPEAPVTENSVNFGTERDVANCPFFLKTGACRFGDRPSSLILVHLFTHGRRSPTECLLTDSSSSCWSMSCMLWCLRLSATAATHSLPSSSGQRQIRRLNDRKCQGETETARDVKDA